MSPANAAGGAPFMSSEDSPSNSRENNAPRAAGASALGEAAQAWTEFVDGWWRQQSAMLPTDLRKAMTSTLDQSKALVDMACAQAAAAMSSDHRADKDAAAESGATGDHPGMWQPIIDACRACEADLLGSAGADEHTRSDAVLEYQRAANEYLLEFAQINMDVARRLQRKFSSGAPADFRQLHDLVVAEAEQAYLERVSGDVFAERQAAYINAMFRLRKAQLKRKPDPQT